MSNTFFGTKGKWEVKHSESKNAFNVIGTVIGGKYKIARIPYEYKLEKEEAKANAQLIAHAPDMLEMLRKLNNELIHCIALLQKDGNIYEVDFQTTQEAAALINRATTI